MSVDAEVQFPILPIQRWFFEHNLFAPHHYNVAFLLQLRSCVDREALRVAVELLVEKHDSLRVQFKVTAKGWLQYAVKDYDPRILQTRDLSLLSEEAQIKAIETISRECQASLVFGDGLLIRAILFNLGQSCPARLLFVLHHLICDGISRRVLIRDLEFIYTRILSSYADVRTPGMLGKKGTSFRDWALRITSQESVANALHAAPYWKHKDILPLPLDFPNGTNVMSEMESIEVEVNQQRTQELQLACERYGANIGDLIVFFAARSISEWTGSHDVLINIVGSGRQTKYEDIDLFRTVGWLAIHFPVFLKMSADANDDNSLMDFMTQLGSVPDHGFGYGILRYIYTQHPHSRAIPLLREPDVGVNYLGDSAGVFSRSGMFDMATENIGPKQDPRSHRLFRLGLICWISDKKLHAQWQFSKALHRRATIELLASSFQRQCDRRWKQAARPPQSVRS